MLLFQKAVLFKYKIWYIYLSSPIKAPASFGYLSVSVAGIVTEALLWTSLTSVWTVVWLFSSTTVSSIGETTFSTFVSVSTGVVSVTGVDSSTVVVALFSTTGVAMLSVDWRLLFSTFWVLFTTVSSLVDSAS